MRHPIAMPDRTRIRPQDLNRLAASIVEEATTAESHQEDTDSKKKNPHTVALGRLGRLKGGKARAKKLTSDQRREIAKKAAKTRWSKK